MNGPDILSFALRVVPSSISPFLPGPFRSWDIALAGNYLYAATGGDGLRTYLIFPQLAIAPTATNTIVLSWPLPPAPGFGLQSSPNLASGSWSEVTNAPVLTNNRNLVVLLAILLVGYAYVWVKGDLDWDKPKPQIPVLRTRSAEKQRSQELVA